jgi:pimeloyl-ACP methyl ester carboxylesterase
MTEETRDVEVPGGKLRVRVTGSGPTVVLVHGLLVSSHVWDRAIPFLSPQLRLVMPDMPLGAHRLPLDADADCSARAHAERLAQVIEATCDEPPTVLGNDTGGAIVQHLCATRPELVGSLILASCDAFWNCPPWILWGFLPAFRIPGFVHVFARAARARTVEWTLLKFVARTVPTAHERQALMGRFFDDRGVQRDVAKLVNALRPSVTRSTVPVLRAWDRPTTVVWGRPDIAFPARHAQRLATLVPGAQLRWIDRSRALVSLDQPERLASLVLEHTTAAGRGRPRFR